MRSRWRLQQRRCRRAFRTVVKKYQKLARIPGFRAGKVPESLIRTKFAKEVRQEVLESLVSEKFRNAIDAQKLRPVSEPQLRELQLFDGQPLKFKAAFEVVPTIRRYRLRDDSCGEA